MLVFLADETGNCAFLVFYFRYWKSLHYDTSSQQTVREIVFSQYPRSSAVYFHP